MTDRAYIHASISLSLQVSELSILGQLIFERLFPHADHQGRLQGHPKKVRMKVIPLVDNSVKDVEDQLRKMHDLGLIVWYEVSGERIIQLVSWWKFQDRRFAHPSKFPAPEGWKDRLRFNHPVTHELVEVNWVGKVPVGRPGKDGSKAPTQDAYVGPYVGSYIGAYEGSEIPPSSSSSSSSSSEKKKTGERSKERGNVCDAGIVVAPSVPSGGRGATKGNGGNGKDNGAGKGEQPPAGTFLREIEDLLRDRREPPT